VRILVLNFNINHIDHLKFNLFSVKGLVHGNWEKLEELHIGSHREMMDVSNW